jgi:oligopeptide/dipeptide ABC transporter ATP-binding protein
MSGPLLEIADLHVRFGSAAAVAGASFSVHAGEAVGVVGESGSGKTASVLAAMRLHPSGARVTAARLALDGKDVLSLPERQMRDLRGRFAAMIFQDPLTALNPLMPVGAQIAEVLTRHRGMRRGAARAEAARLLAEVGIQDPAARARRFPHEFSGGMRQRVMIAAALAGGPSLLIADEPTTALDATVQGEIARLVRALRIERGMGLIWVTHDLALMAGIVDRAVVMYAGRVVETAPVDALYAAPLHPYTAALLDSLPRLDRPRGRTLSGQPPDPAAPPQGCPFAPRCPRLFARCAEAPPMIERGPSAAACWLVA